MILKGFSHLDSITLGFWDECCQAMMCHRHLPVLVENLDSIWVLRAAAFPHISYRELCWG